MHLKKAPCLLDHTKPPKHDLTTATERVSIRGRRKVTGCWGTAGKRVASIRQAGLNHMGPRMLAQSIAFQAVRGPQTESGYAQSLSSLPASKGFDMCS